MDVDEAASNFREAMGHCLNLTDIHRSVGGPKRGRRFKEASLNRAVVVMTVAAWQAVVQDLTRACVDYAAPASTSPLSKASYDLLAGRVRKEVEDFGTPNFKNTNRLFLSAGFDVQRHWRWSQNGGRGKPLVFWNSGRIKDRMNEWLEVRHALAHGHEHLPQVSALQSIRIADAKGKDRPASPKLRLIDSKQCIAFFKQLAKKTGDGVSQQYQVRKATW